jgi:tRNA(Ile)-lysidine synthase
LAAADLTLAEDGSGLLLRLLDRLGPARARNLLRYWLKRETGVLPSRAWLEDALSQLMNAQPDRHPELRVGGRVLRRRGDHALLTELLLAAADAEGCWRGEPELILAREGRLCFLPSMGEGLAADRVPVEGARIAWRKGGERLRPDCRRPGRTLKNLLREAAVATEERDRLPLLFIGDRLAWAAGLGVDCAFQAGPGEPGWLISWCPPGR